MTDRHGSIGDLYRRLAGELSDHAAVRSHYQRSLALRPGNATVQSALDALPP